MSNGKSNPDAGVPDAGATDSVPSDAGLPGAGKDANQCFKTDPVGGQTPVACPTCATDFVITAPCRILKAGGGSVQMSASDPPSPPPGGFIDGTYVWSTTSTKITLTNTNSPTVTVQPQASPSSGRDAET